MAVIFNENALRGLTKEVFENMFKKEFKKINGELELMWKNLNLLRDEVVVLREDLKEKV